MNRKLISIFLLALVLHSCDPFYNAKIINKSNKPLKVIFEYDKEVIKKNIKRKISFTPEVVYNNENTRTSFEIDTINFIVTANVQTKDTLDLEMGIGTQPDFRNIQMIKIYGTDTIYLKNNEKMIKAFTEKGKYHYELIVK
ncbi:hypothetical protein AB9K26_01080 [Psychroserpens sp. XS_ASV72]|uniref:hypothetical protein n=1 Tax=Psychroserpens sp. XS_ASV72 TaxID=3241293 RepID=UPI003513DB7B